MSKTKKFFSLVIAMLLAVVIAVLPTAQVVARADENIPDGENAPGKYISEVRVGLGKSKDAAAASLEGYTILKDDDGEYADLNKDAGSNSIIGSKGDKVVLLGFKTTNDPKDAITDLAVMNMDGGYSVRDYEALMDKYLETQLKPMIEGFIAAIQEYRENYSSSNPANKKRAQFAHDMLNLLYDDDTDSYIGDLLLNETKWEMGDEAYDKLSEAEKKQHADLVTIFEQANGKATLSIQNLLARAADTSDNTWIERFVAADAEALEAELFPGMLPTDAGAMMDNIFGNDARKILTMWDDLQREIKDYDKAVEFVENYDMKPLEDADSVLEGFDANSATADEKGEAIVAFLETETMEEEFNYYASVIALHDFLSSIEYFDEFTLFDYFSQTKEDAASDMMTLYALVSSLSPGQRAGLDYISLKELVLMANTNADEYSSEGYAGMGAASIYEGVDRQIYEKGGVALTSDALRKQADAKDSVDNYPLSALTTVMWGVTAASIIASIGSWYKYTLDVNELKTASLNAHILRHNLNNGVDISKGYKMQAEVIAIGEEVKSFEQLTETYGAENAKKIIAARNAKDLARNLSEADKSSFSQKLAIGFTVATVILTALSVYMTYRDLCDYYDTDFSPIPTYMVDEADITAKNAKGETIVIKNQTAYYKAALCNRTEKDEKYGEIGDKADLNGDVGRKWVALYSVKNEAQNPILADSFKVVYGTSNVPLDYERSLHKFGSGAAFDLNNTYYAWNHGKGGIYVYYKLDDDADSRANAVGTVQTAGTLAAVGVGGIIIGMLIGSFTMGRRNKKEKEQEAA